MWTDILFRPTVMLCSMRVRSWDEILAEIADVRAEPDRWRAAAGPRASGLGEDLFIGHPRVGVYQLKTYAKSPMELRGVGQQVARRIDDGIDPLLPHRERADHEGRFGVRTAPADADQASAMAKQVEETLRTHSIAPTGAEDLFEDMMQALESPAYGPMRYRPRERSAELDALSGEFPDADALLSRELDDLIDADGVNHGVY
jgi:hypothetical protein